MNIDVKQAIPCMILIAAAVGWHSPVQADQPRSVEEAVRWLQNRSRAMIQASRRTMRDGVAAFPPQVETGYEAFWLRDYAYMLEGYIDAFTDKELLDACQMFLKAQRADGACVDCVKFDGTPIYQPGYGSMGENPVADGSQFTVAVAWYTNQRTTDRELARRMVDQLVKAMNAVPRNPKTGLVYISDKGWDRCPYGFTDSVRKQGDELFCSLLYVQASRQLADLLEVADRPTDAATWRGEANRVSESIRTVFWDGSIGLFRAATLQCKEPDIWGSAFAVYLDVAARQQALAIADYFKQNYGAIVQAGQIRHLPGGMYWEIACERDTYQNGGFWATPTGWFVYTLDLVDPQLADQTVLDMVCALEQNGCAEWVFGNQKGVPNYLASVALPIAGIHRTLDRRKAVLHDDCSIDRRP